MSQNIQLFFERNRSAAYTKYVTYKPSVIHFLNNLTISARVKYESLAKRVSFIFQETKSNFLKAYNFIRLNRGNIRILAFNAKSSVSLFIRQQLFHIQFIAKKIFNLRPKYFTKTMNLINIARSQFEDAKRHKLEKNQKIKVSLHWIKTSVILGAIGVAIVSSWIFESIMMKPISLLFDYKKSSNQVSEDISKIQNVDELRNYCHQFVKDQELFKDKTPVKINKYIDRALSTYGSTYDVYGPVVMEWAHSLLETAKTYEPPQRLVFMARDGIAPYKVAKLLKERHPEKYGDVPLSLVYLSRKVINWSITNEDRLRDYMVQRGVKQGEACIFVDVGFTGSMIKSIKKALHNVTANIRFAYLVSLTQDANGFMSNMETRLDSVPQAGVNPAVHWIEDTHQGIVDSPTSLVVEGDRIRPNTKAGIKMTCKETYPKSYLYKTLGFKAIMDYAESHFVATDYLEKGSKPQPYRMADESTKCKFDAFLSLYRTGERVSYAQHF